MQNSDIYQRDENIFKYFCFYKHLLKNSIKNILFQIICYFKNHF